MLNSIKNSVNQQNIAKGAQYANTANSLVRQFVITPVMNMGLAGFVFSSETEYQCNLTSDVTDYYVEDNTVRQDHIARHPVEITLRGSVAEVVYIAPQNQKTPLQNTTERSTMVSALLPQMTNATQQAFDAIFKSKTKIKDYLQDTATLSGDLYTAYKKLNVPQTAQAQAFNFFYAMWDSKQEVSLQTPWNFFSNMYIVNVASLRSQDNPLQTDFTITLKEVLVFKTTKVKYDATQFRGYTQAQATEMGRVIKAQGTAVAKEKLQSALSKGLSPVLKFFGMGK
jgi:hypothetical protein